MRTLKLFTSVALAFVISACSTARQTYVQQHPELSAQQRKIVLAGRIKFGDPVAGMTRDQVRATMGTDPDQFDNINGEDAWIWIRTKNVRSINEPPNPADNGGSARDGGGGPRGNGKSKELGDTAEPETGPTKTVVYFKGNVATHADVLKGSF